MAKRNRFREFCEGIEQIEQIIETTRRYKTIAKDGAISEVCLKKEDGIFTENKEDRVHPLLRTHFPGSYCTAAGDNILTDTPTTNERGRNENWKLAKEVCSETRVRWDPFHPKSFRPIWLTSFVLKTVEKVIDITLEITFSVNTLAGQDGKLELLCIS